MTSVHERRALTIALVGLVLSACGSGTQLPQRSVDCGPDACSADDSLGLPDAAAVVAPDLGVDGHPDSPPDLPGTIDAALASDLAADRPLDLADLQDGPPDHLADVPPDLAPDSPVDLTPDLAPDLARDALPELPVDVLPPDAAPGTLVVTPNFHEFMPILVGSVESSTFTVSNQGSTTLSNLALMVVGVDFTLLADANHCAGLTQLGPGASCQFDVQFRPAQLGSRVGALVASVSGQTVTVSLTGVGLSVADLRPSPEAVYFASRVGVTGPPVTVIIRNIGDLPTSALTVEVLDSQFADFTMISNGCRAPLAPSATCEIQLALKPSAAGLRLATLYVSYPAGGVDLGGVMTVPLLGMASTTGMLGLFSGFTDFLQPVNVESTPSEFRVWNTGDTTSPLSVVSDSNEFFLSANDCANRSLPFGGLCTFSVKFKPATPGSKSALVTVSGGSPAETVTVQLTGSTL